MTTGFIKLMSLLKDRLRSNGKEKTSDKDGNVVYIDCDIFSDEVLTSFLTLSLSEFNQTPYFTSFTFDDAEFVELFADILVEGAMLYALSSQALVERGREFLIIENGITFDPPVLSEMLETQYSTLLSHHYQKLSTIKGALQSGTWK